MSEYPDEDEEFELMYGDELDILKENNDFNNYQPPENNARRSLDFSSPAIKKTFPLIQNTAKESNTNVLNGFNDPLDSSTQKSVTSPKKTGLNISGIDHLSASTSTQNLDATRLNTITEDEQAIALPKSQINVPNHKDSNAKDVGIEDALFSVAGAQKRDIEDLFGDIDDMDFDEDALTQASKRLKISEDEIELRLIEKILDGRRRRKGEMSNLAGILNRDFTDVLSYTKKDNLSYNIPRWPFIPLKRSDGEKVYVRMHNEEYMEKEIDEVSRGNDGFKNLLGNSFKEIWSEARTYLGKKQSLVSVSESSVPMDIEGLEQAVTVCEDSGELWVDKYKPMRYMELLSDESTNRTLLHWLKMWDKVVFNREVKIKKPEVTNSFNKRSGKFEFGKRKWGGAPELEQELDEHGRPHHKLALLCGPPGCGKTTLAHMIAKHAGYKAVEVNASDDRSVDAFKTALENATQMKSVLDQQRRPNCLILDEIDGAPIQAIEYLIKFISGTSAKAKKGQKAKSHILKRPIICICNDPYTPSLRPLRQVAFVVHFPPTQVSRLAQRLSEVSQAQGLQVDLSTLTALGEKTSNDVRACLGVLHFFKAKGKQIKLADIQKFNVGLKDMSKGLFQVWQEIFQIQPPRLQRLQVQEPAAGSGQAEVQDKDVNNLKYRAKNILSTVYSAGEYDRLSQGVYENYLSMKMRDGLLVGVCQALDWFTTSDVFSTYISSHQNYSLMPYLPHAFVCWHFLFAGLSWPKIKFPSQGFEVFQRQTQMSAIVTSMDKGMCPKVKVFNTKSTLVMDTLPLLPHVVSPNLRPVNIQLYTEREKRDLSVVVGVMLDYNIQYLQERTMDGSYTYNLDPDITKVGIFDEKSSSLRQLSYAMKQLIAHEVELEKISRMENRAAPAVPRPAPRAASTATASCPPEPEEQQALPNFLQRLQPKTVKPKKSTGVMKDFFGRIVACSPKTAAKRGKNKVDEIVKSPVWYHYKEGFNNAVRRDIKISDLL